VTSYCKCGGLVHCDFAPFSCKIMLDHTNEQFSTLAQWLKYNWSYFVYHDNWYLFSPCNFYRREMGMKWSWNQKSTGHINLLGLCIECGAIPLLPAFNLKVTWNHTCHFFPSTDSLLQVCVFKISATDCWGWGWRYTCTWQESNELRACKLFPTDVK
jgi:hypothetical protein